MPRDGFTFSIRVGREDKLVGTPERVLNILNPFLGLRVHRPAHGELIFWINRPIFGRKITNMTETGKNLIVLPEIFFDGFGLGRRLDDDEIHTGTLYM